MGGLFGSITIKGNRLSDLVGQTSTVGRPIPRGWGTVRVEEPNVIWTAGIPKEHVKKKKQGKGGVKTEEYTYTLSYAIAFMRGPVHGFLTIKRGGKVVYTNDPNASVDDKAYAAKWLQSAKLYLGTETQMPDATIESYVGAGQVSAFRGLCYIVVKDDDVTSESGAVPQYEAVIIASPPEIYLTSKPYPVNTLEGFTMPVQMPDAKMRLMPYVTEPFTAVPTVLEGTLRDTVRIYRLAPESFTFTDQKIVSGTLQLKVKSYRDWPPEAFTVAAPSVTQGTLRQLVIVYQIPIESFTVSSPSITSGTMS